MIRAVIFDYGAVLRKNLRLQKPLFDFAAQLRAEGYETAVLSNMYAPLTWTIKKMGDLRDFKPVIFSSDIEIRKPNAGAYEAVIKQLGMSAGECLFVDNRRDNLEGAQKIGMRIVLSKNTDQTIADIRQQLGLS